MKKLKINPKLLLAIYFVMPIGFIVVGFDYFLYSSILQSSLPVDPHEFILFTIFFTLPHVLASFFGYLEKDYLNFYKKRLIKGARIIGLFVLVMPIISMELTFYIFAIYTMVHVILQQSGICKSLMRGGNKYFQYWQVLAIILSSTIYIGIFTSLDLYTVWGIRVLAIMATIVTILALLSYRASKTYFGKIYFWGTHFIPLSAGIFIALGYPIFAIAIPRIIHDLTAFIYYIVHDHNRFTETNSNYLYRTASALKIRVMVLSPLAAVLLAYFLQQSNSGYVSVFVMFVLLYHYFTEGFAWKRESLHRKQIAYLPIK